MNIFIRVQYIIKIIKYSVFIIVVVSLVLGLTILTWDSGRKYNTLS